MIDTVRRVEPRAIAAQQGFDPGRPRPQHRQLDPGVADDHPRDVVDLQALPLLTDPFAADREPRVEGQGRRRGETDAGGEEPQAGDQAAADGPPAPGGEPAHGERGPRQHHNAVLAGQRRQHEQRQGAREQRPAPAGPRPGARRAGETGEPCQHRSCEEDVLPDDGRIDGELGRRHAGERERRGNEPRPRTREQHERQQRAVDQRHVQRDERAPAGPETVRRPKQPRHHRRVLAAVEARPPLGELDHGVVGEMPRQVEPETSDGAGDDDRGGREAADQDRGLFRRDPRLAALRHPDQAPPPEAPARPAACQGSARWDRPACAPEGSVAFCLYDVKERYQIT